MSFPKHIIIDHTKEGDEQITIDGQPFPHIDLLSAKYHVDTEGGRGGVALVNVALMADKVTVIAREDQDA